MKRRSSGIVSLLVYTDSAVSTLFFLFVGLVFNNEHVKSLFLKLSYSRTIGLTLVVPFTNQSFVAHRISQPIALAWLCFLSTKTRCTS
jgi:hypothetical protein